MYVNHFGKHHVIGLRLGLGLEWTAGLRLGAWQIVGMVHVGNDNEHVRVTPSKCYYCYYYQY